MWSPPLREGTQPSTGNWIVSCALGKLCFSVGLNCYRVSEHCSEMRGNGHEGETLKDDQVDEAVQRVDLRQKNHSKDHEFGVKDESPESIKKNSKWFCF
jgi:hypothetical protein